jgi:hypothetical protein
MRNRILTLCLCASGLGGIARAEDVAPGLWELSLEAKVDAEPGFQPGPMTLTQCITKQDAQDPGKVLSPLASAGATDCTYTNKSYAGQEFRFTMQCAGTLGLTTTGVVTFSATTLHGAMTTSSLIEGKSVEFKSTLTGHRVGGCSAP